MNDNGEYLLKLTKRNVKVFGMQMGENACVLIAIRDAVKQVVNANFLTSYAENETSYANFLIGHARNEIGCANYLIGYASSEIGYANYFTSCAESARRHEYIAARKVILFRCFYLLQGRAMIDLFYE